MNDESRKNYHRAYINNDLETVGKMLPELPQSVIKFFSGTYSGENNRHLDLLKRRQLWVTAPRFFNDPFDCAINIDYGYSSYQIFLKKLYAFLNKESADEVLESVKKDKAMFDGFLNYIAYDYKRYAQEVADQFFVSCFSELSNLKSLRMWGHYANSHRGFCLEYSTYEIYQYESSEIPKDRFIEFLPVCYSNNYILRESGEKTRSGVREFLLTYAFVKAREWDYEKEWRLIMVSNKDKGKKGVTIPFLAPVRVYLGCKIEERLKADILQICKHIGIDAYQAYMEPNSYNLSYKKVEK